MDRTITPKTIEEFLTNENIGLWSIETDPGKPPRMYANAKMRELLDVREALTPEEVYNAWYDCIDPDHYVYVDEMVEKMTHGEHGEVQYIWHHPEAGKIYVRCGGGRDMTYEEGVRISGYYRDISHLVRLEMQTKELESVLAALTEDYVAFFHVDFDTEEEITFRVSSGIRRWLQMLPAGIPFEKRLVSFAEEFVAEEDRERYIAEMQRDTILKSLRKRNLHTVRFRMREDGQLRWYEIRMVHHREHAGRNCAAVGIHDIDETVREEEKRRAEILREAALRAFFEEDILKESGLLFRPEEQQNAIRGFVNILNRGTDASQAIRELIALVGNYYDADRTYLFELNYDAGTARNTYEWCREGVAPQIEKLQETPASYIDTWTEAFRTNELYVMRTIDDLGPGTPEYELLKAQGIRNLMAVPILQEDRIIGFIGMDNPRRALDDILILRTAASLVHSEILFRLQSTPDGRLLEGVRVLVADDDAVSRDMNSEILAAEGAIVSRVENGREAVEAVKESAAFDLILMDTVMPEMSGKEATELIRQMDARVPIIAVAAEDGDSQVMELLRVGANENVKKPIVVSDLSRILITCMKSYTEKMEQQLAETMRIANTDALTHVKNIAAYTDKVAELAEKIRAGEQPHFAIVMCDINDLKKENDTNGHDSGDLYIKNCSKLICHVFAHSPVYRIGGDEFAAVLQGTDYANAAQLIRELQMRNEEMRRLAGVEEGRASVSSGLAVYSPMLDLSVSDVIKRADVAMYENKRILKARK